MRPIDSIREKNRVENLLSSEEGSNFLGRYVVVIMRRTGWFLRDLFVKGKIKWRDDAYILKRIYAGHNEFSNDIAKKWGASRPSNPANPDLYNCPPISQIVPGLYLGRLSRAGENDGADNRAVINRLGIKTIVMCLLDRPYNHDGVNIVQLPHQDSDEVDITPFFEQSFTAIEESLKKNEKVLVHCSAGVSRSVSQVIAYLIKKHAMSYEQALTHVRSIRPCALPNPGFSLQLRAFAERCKQPG